MRLASVTRAPPPPSASVPEYSALPTTTASTPSSRRAHTSSATRTPPLAMTGRSVSVPIRSYSARSGPSIVPSRAIEVTRNRGTPASLSAGSSRPRGGVPLPCQPWVIDAPVLHVDRDDDRVAELARRPRRRTRGRAPPRSRGSRGPPRPPGPPRSRRRSASPPPSCTGIATLRQIVLHDLAVRAVAARGVEVDDVQPAGPSASNRFATSTGSSSYAVSASKSPAEQADAASAAEVDRRDRRSRRALLHERRVDLRVPARPDFSGWNCVANSVVARDGGGEPRVRARSRRRTPRRCPARNECTK